MLSKGVYTYEYTDEWEKFNEVSLRGKELFYSPINVEVTDSDYNHAKRVYSPFEIKILGEYHHLYLKNDILLLADVFKKCLKIFELYSAKFLPPPGLAKQAVLKKPT